MRSVPKLVNVGGKRIKIRVKPDLEEWGVYYHDLGEIWLAEKSIKNNLETTLRHEIMHAALAISGVSFMEGFQEEAVVRCFDDIFFPAWEKILPKLI